MAIWCGIILTVWIWLLRYLYRTYNEFYILLEQIYSGEYFKDQQNGDNSRSGNETPTMDDDGAEVEAECIELDTFEPNDNDNDNDNNNDTDDNNENSIDNSNDDNDK